MRIYEFDPDLRLKACASPNRDASPATATGSSKNVQDHRVRRRQHEGHHRADRWTWETVLKPSILTVYQVAPERLDMNALYDNIRVLGDNAQKTSRFEIAFWNKLFYPAAVLVMMVLALPFAHFQRRQGGVGFRIFAGTMLGLAFFLVGRLFSYLGVLNDWPPLFSAVFPLVVVHRRGARRCCGGWSGASRRKIRGHGHGDPAEG